MIDRVDQRVVPLADLDRFITPRVDRSVVERLITAPSNGVAGTYRFEAVGGPWATYERTVEVTPQPRPQTDADIDVREQVVARLAIPIWGWAFNRLAARDVLTVDHRTGGNRWWNAPVLLNPAQSRLLSYLCGLAVLAGFVSSLASRILTFAVDEFMPEATKTAQTSAVTTSLTIIRIGVVIALASLALADRVGRRRVLRFAVWAGLVATILGAVAPNLAFLVGVQTAGKNFGAAITILLAIIAAEELPAGSRAYATGLLGMSFALGAGMVLMVLALADVGIWGWRLSCLAGAGFLAVAAFVSPRLPETQRFLVREATSTDTGRVTWRSIAPRLGVMAALFFSLNVFTTPSSQLQTDYLRSDRGYSAGLISLFLIATNTPGGLGVVIGGKWSDLRGRKLVAMVGLIGIALQGAIFMTSGAAMWVVSLLSAVIGGMAVPALGAFGPELFPTRWRSSANGVLNATALGGGVVGLTLAQHFIVSAGYGTAFGVLFVAIGATAIALAMLPESAGRELEDLNRSPLTRRE